VAPVSTMAVRFACCFLGGTAVVGVLVVVVFASVISLDVTSTAGSSVPKSQ
jgi:hypothetical protein